MLPAPTWIVGHRGARGEAPENTLASFQIAIDAGAAEIELDVRLSSDNHLVVLHDKNINRTTWGKGGAQRYTLAELNLIDARRNTPGWHAFTGIPSLADVVNMCPAHMRFQFEVKSDTRERMHIKAARLKHLIDEMGLRERAVVTSSDGDFLRMVGAMDEHINRGFVCEYSYLQPFRRTRTLGCKWLIAHYSLIDRRLMKRLRERGMKISAWTVNDLNEAERLVALGVDSIITDFPTSFVRHFESRAARMLMAQGAF